jgi:hypothetical protein
MVQVTRRFFLTSCAALSAGCAVRRPAAEPATSSAKNIRQPVVGQSWRYAKHDAYTHEIVDNPVDRVAVITRTIEIDSSNEVARDESASRALWGTGFLRKYMPHRDNATGALPSEIQDSWGMVLVDPHWGQVQVYERAIPLWPTQLQPGWRTRVSTKYKTPSNQDGLPWEQTMKAHDWETISVPAGQFRALRYSNVIKFGSSDITRTDSVRQETLWFAPEVGRWIARESTGSYYMDDSAVDQPYNESGYRWELLEWS